MAIEHPTKLAPEQLRWICDPERFAFSSTRDLEITDTILGQDTAREALVFGIECLAYGQNIFVRGVRGTGRITLVRQVLKQLKPQTDQKRDRCSVHNFRQPDRPRLITLAAGTAPAFKKRVGELVDFVQDGLLKALDSEPHLSRREKIKLDVQKEIRAISEPLEKQLAENGMALVTVQQGPVNSTVIFPVIDGEPIPPEQLQQLIAQGKADQENLTRYEEKLPEFQKELDRVSREMSAAFRDARHTINRLKQDAARQLLSGFTNTITSEFKSDSVNVFIEEIIKDVVENRLSPDEEDEQPVDELYGVNIIISHNDLTNSPVVEEVVPNLINLLGTVEVTYGSQTPVSDYRGIRGGAILNADSGYLLLDAEDLLNEPGAYRALTRTLRTRHLEIVPPEIGWLKMSALVQPEPIPVNLRVILVGDVSTFYQLDYHDPDFSELFKVLADFDDQLPRDDHSLQHYAIVIGRMVQAENLTHFDKTAIAALVEHGSRIVSRSERLTAKFGRIADIAREAAFIAKKENAELVTGDHVRECVRRTRKRASLPSRRFQEMVDNRTIQVDTSGSVVGQINGLAVIHSGPLTYGFPARITASIGPGTAGLINIEGSARMSGSIHTKGFQILGGLLRNLLKTNHPLSFSASITFEQSYGGIDGDSASGAEMVCLLSALTGIPIRQNLAMTGAIDQLGHLQAIGGVNEKIEGFFDACNHAGLTGDQGVVIPKSNAGDLMLRHDVVEAAKAGKFHVYAVETIHEAIELFTGIPTSPSDSGTYPDNSLLGIAVQKARDYWEKTLAAPARLTQTAVAETSDAPTPLLPVDASEKESKNA
ncbi:MAG: AAA family ATPase [Pirellulaceae bacterium]